MKSQCVWAILLLVLATGGLHASGTITGLCPTGYQTYTTANGCGNPVAQGANDGNYTYTTSPNLGSGSAVVLSTANELAAYGLSANQPLSWYGYGVDQWVSTANSKTPNPGGATTLTVNYSINFTLTGVNLASDVVQISGAWTADDAGLGLLVNGHAIPGNYLGDSGDPTDLPWSTIYNFSFSSTTLASLNSWLTNGVNTLTFSVDQADDRYDGLLVTSLGGTINPGPPPPPPSGVPEPTSMVLIAAGLGALVLRRGLA